MPRRTKQRHGRIFYGHVPDARDAPVDDDDEADIAANKAEAAAVKALAEKVKYMEEAEAAAVMALAEKAKYMVPKGWIINEFTTFGTVLATDRDTGAVHEFHATEEEDDADSDEFAEDEENLTREEADALERFGRKRTKGRLRKVVSDFFAGGDDIRLAEATDLFDRKDTAFEVARRKDMGDAQFLLTMMAAKEVPKEWLLRNAIRMNKHKQNAITWIYEWIRDEIPASTSPSGKIIRPLTLLKFTLNGIRDAANAADDAEFAGNMYEYRGVLYSSRKKRDAAIKRAQKKRKSTKGDVLEDARTDIKTGVSRRRLKNKREWREARQDEADADFFVSDEEDEADHVSERLDLVKSALGSRARRAETNFEKLRVIERNLFALHEEIEQTVEAFFNGQPLDVERLRVIKAEYHPLIREKEKILEAEAEAERLRKEKSDRKFAEYLAANPLAVAAYQREKARKEKRMRELDERRKRGLPVNDMEYAVWLSQRRRMFKKMGINFIEKKKKKK